MIMNKRDFLKKISSTSLLFFSLLPINFFIDINKSINLPTGSDFLVNGVGFDERVDDRLSNLLQEGEGINFNYGCEAF